MYRRTITYQVVLLLALSTSWFKASSEILRETYTCELKCICYNKPYDGQDERFVAECTNVKEDDLENLRNLPSNVTDLIIANSTLPTLDFSSIPTHFMKLLCVTFDGCNSTYIKLTQRSEYVNLQNITVRNNPIDIIRENTFQQFPNVQHINFDNNKVGRVYEDAFKDLYSLEIINISSNDIITTENGFYKNVPSLKLIDLSNNMKLVPVTSTYYEKRIPLILFSHNVTTTNEWSLGSYQMFSSIHNVMTNEWSLGFYQIFNSISIRPEFLFLCVAGVLSLLTLLSSSEESKQKIEHIHRYYFFITQKTIGQIIIDPNTSLGDNVWKGSLKDGRKAAIKKSRKASGRARKELDIYLRISQTFPNPHVVQYMCKEEDDTYLYIALELFDMNLEKAIRTKYIGVDMLNSYLLQLAAGLKHIHKHGVTHRDIKPRNILLKKVLNEGEPDKIIFAISDFDLGHLEKETSEHKKPYGTSGWAAPELWQGGVRTTAVDIFSLGCVFYYVLTNGCHPFGPIDNLKECQTCICNGTEKPKLRKLKIEDKQEFKVILAKELITSMIERDQRKRTKAKLILHHPLFWTDEEISDFYHKIGNMADDKEQTKFQSILRADSNEIYSGDWTSQLDEPVISDIIKKNKKINKSDICKLLKTIRNKTEHINDDLSEELKSIYYCCREGVARYFNEKFPNLLLYTFQKKEELDCTS